MDTLSLSLFLSRSFPWKVQDPSSEHGTSKISAILSFFLSPPPFALVPSLFARAYYLLAVDSKVGLQKFDLVYLAVQRCFSTIHEKSSSLVPALSLPPPQFLFISRDQSQRFNKIW